jgi:hypothetical protein
MFVKSSKLKLFPVTFINLKASYKHKSIITLNTNYYENFKINFAGLSPGCGL